MNEEPRRFGSDARLAGILCVPDQARGNRTAVICITAGLLHRPGPYRLYVGLSRMLATTGFPSLRFDLSGIGESRSRDGNASAEIAAVADVREAMDMVQEALGCDCFVLVGLCSGAEVAHRTAVADPRVCGIVAMDGYIPRTHAFYLWHYLPRLFSARKWAGFVAAKLRRLLGRQPASELSADDAALSFWEGAVTDRDRHAAELEALCVRGVRQLQVFSGGSGDCSYENQYRDAFRAVPMRGLVDLRFLADSDHMYILHGDRLQLMRTIAHWVREHFALAPGAQAAGRLSIPRLSARRAARPALHGVSIPHTPLDSTARRDLK